MANELRVRQIGIGGLIETAVNSTDATLDSAGLAAVTGGIGSTQHLAVVFDPDSVEGAPEVIYVTALTNGASSGTIARGQEGTTGRSHAAGTPWVHGPTLRDVIKTKQATRTGGDITLNATAITNVDTGLDLVLPAYAGDLIEYGISGRVDNVAVVSEFDVYTIVGGSPVNPLGAGLSASLASVQGVPGWRCPSGVEVDLTGSIVATLVSGDISSSTVTLRLRYAQSASTSRTLHADSNTPLRVWAKNLGPAPG